jgi:DNA-3-methyladenine glycosylase I
MMTRNVWVLVLDGFKLGCRGGCFGETKTFRVAFDSFDPEKLQNIPQRHWASNERSNVIKNRAKISATITNAATSKGQKEFGSFDKFIWQFVDGKTIQNAFKDSSEMSSETEQSRAISENSKRGASSLWDLQYAMPSCKLRD